MTTVIIIAIIYGIYRLCKSAADRAQADRAERERQRIREFATAHNLSVQGLFLAAVREYMSAHNEATQSED